jgi:hypothetical protein
MKNHYVFATLFLVIATSVFSPAYGGRMPEEMPELQGLGSPSTRIGEGEARFCGARNYLPSGDVIEAQVWKNDDGTTKGDLAIDMLSVPSIFLIYRDLQPGDIVPILGKTFVVTQLYWDERGAKRILENSKRQPPATGVLEYDCITLQDLGPDRAFPDDAFVLFPAPDGASIAFGDNRVITVQLKYIGYAEGDIEAEIVWQDVDLTIENVLTDFSKKFELHDVRLHRGDVLEIPVFGKIEVLDVQRTNANQKSLVMLRPDMRAP